MIAHPFTRRPLRLAASACVALVIASAAGAQESTTGGCCTITSIDAEKGLVTAKERSTERTFLFTVSDRSVLASLRVGRPVYANYRTNEVSVDGKKACCAIVGAAVATTRPIAAPIVTSAEPAPIVR